MPDVDTRADLDIGILRADEAEARHVLGQQAFGHARPYDPDGPVPTAWHIVARRGGRIVAAVTHLRFAQWWGGRAVPMGGIAGVNVAPEARGSGLARTLLRVAFDEMRAEGTPISTLYPTTGTLYRSVGYGWGGEWAVSSLPLSMLPERADPHVEIVPVDPQPGPAAMAVYDLVGARSPGWLARNPEAWAFVDAAQRRSGTPRYAYEARRGDQVVGYTSYQAIPAERAGFLVQVDELFAADGGAMATLLALHAGNTTMADELHTRVPVRSLLPHLRHAQRARRVRDWWWMSRLVDLPGAFAARGWPPAVSAEVHLRVADDDIRANDGPWVLTVADGVGRLERGGTGRIRVDVADLATVFTGAMDPFTLAAEGLLPGAREVDLLALAAAVAGPPPTLPDFF